MDKIEYISTKQKNVVSPFNKACHSYDQHAMVQHNIGLNLLNTITTKSPTTVLDIGCGTGISSLGLSNKFPCARIDAMDAASNMINYCKNTILKKNLHFFQGNFLKDPVPNHYELIASNATFQWFSNLPFSLARCRALLTKNGQLHFTIFGPKTFQELAHVLRKNSDPHIRLAAESFPNKNKLIQALEKNYRSFTIQQSTFYINFPSLIHLLKSIKYTGTRGTISTEKLWTPAYLNKLENDYIKTYGTIYASYDVYFVTATV